MNLPDTAAEQCLKEGYELSFIVSPPKFEQGRQAFLKAVELGRDEGHFYIGRTYELQQNFIAAEAEYSRGLEKGNGPSIYRLALLHKGGRVEQLDMAFYLDAMDKLSTKGHIPSRIRFHIEAIKGSYGFVSRVISIAVIAPVLFISFIKLVLRPDAPEARHRELFA